MAEEVASKRIKTEKDHGAGPEPDGAAAEGGRSDGEIFVKIQSEVLRCRICLEPLKPPVFKCEAGHVLCSVCMEKLREVGSVLGLGIFCDVCRKNTSYCRCVELEQFIDAIKVPCSNQTYGCNESIIYHEKEKHETECTHSPCYCPENDCDFRGATCCLLDHFVTAHGWSPANFSYNKPLKISVARDHQFTLLVGEDQTMFLLTNTLTEIGSAITMVCVRPHESEPSYSCNISAAHVVAGGRAEGRLVFQKDPLVSSSSLTGAIEISQQVVVDREIWITHMGSLQLISASSCMLFNHHGLKRAHMLLLDMDVERSTRPGEVVVEELPSYLTVPPRYLVGAGASKEVSLDIRIDKIIS